MTAVVRREEPSFDADLAVKGFFRDPDWMFKIGIGQVVNASALLIGLANPMLFPLLLALSSLTTGFSLRMVRFRALAVEDKLPEWNEWLELTVSGLTWLALLFGFWSAVTAVASVIYMFGSRFATTSTETAWIIAGVLVTFGAALVISFYTSYLMVNFALEESIKAAFAVREVTKRLLADPRAMVAGWLMALGLPGAAILLPSLTVIGLFFVPATVFAANVMAADILAQVWIRQDKPGDRSIRRSESKKPSKGSGGGTGGSRPGDNLPKPSGTKRNP